MLLFFVFWVSDMAAQGNGNGKGGPPVGAGPVLPFWKLTGNSVSASDFIGSTNNFPLHIRVNNAPRASFTNGGLEIYGNTHTTSATIDSIAIAWKVFVNEALKTKIIHAEQYFQNDTLVDLLGMQADVGNLQLAVGSQQTAIGSQQYEIDSLSAAQAEQQNELDSVIAVIAADTISSNDFLPISGGTLTGDLTLTGNLTLNSSSQINSNAGTSGLSLSYGGMPNVVGLATDIAGGGGQFLAFVPPAVAPMLNPNTPNGVIILKDENPLGAVHLATGSSNNNPEGSGITVNGGAQNISIYNSTGDGILIDGVNGQSTWNAQMGLKFTGGAVEVNGLRFADGTVQTTSASGIQSSQWTTNGNKISYPATGTGVVEINGNLKTSAVHGSGGLFLSGIDPAISPNSKAGSITLTPPPGSYYPGGDVILKGGGDGDYYSQEGGAKITLKGYNYYGNR